MEEYVSMETQKLESVNVWKDKLDSANYVFSRFDLESFYNQNKYKEVFVNLSKLFEDSLEGNYDLIIIKERRAFVLFIVYLYIISKHLDDKKIKNILGRVYSDSDIGRVLLKFKNKKKLNILLVDDIIIHGRGLKKLELLISSVLHESRISIFACVKCKDAEYSFEGLDLQLKFNHDNIDACCVSKSFWKQLSNALVDIIQNSGFSYSTFVPIYSENESNPVSLFKKNAEICNLRKNSAQIRNNLNGELALYFNNIENKREVDEPLCSYSLIRKYVFNNQSDVNHRSDKRLIVPMVILPFAKVVSFQNCDYTLELIESIALGIYKEETNKFSKKLLTSMNKKFESYELSDFYHDLVFAKTGNESGISIKYINGFDAYDACNDSSDIWVKSLIWEEKLSIDDNVQIMIDDFIHNLHQENERRAIKKLPRLPGAFILTMISCLCDKYPEKNPKELITAFFKVMISCWDSGMANYTVSTIEVCGECYVGGSITDGEQAYHAPLEPNAFKEIGCLRYIYNYCNNLQSTRDVVECLVNILKCNNEKCLDTSYLNNLMDYISNNNHYAELWSLYPLSSPSTTVKKYIKKAITEVFGSCGWL